MGGGGDGGDEGFQDAVQGEEGDVVAVDGEHGAGGRPGGAGDVVEEKGCGGGADAGDDEGEEAVEM